ncbi:conserved hypothetical protein [Pseudomonas serboccidentalis]
MHFKIVAFPAPLFFRPTHDEFYFFIMSARKLFLEYEKVSRFVEGLNDVDHVQCYQLSLYSKAI